MYKQFRGTMSNPSGRPGGKTMTTVLFKLFSGEVKKSTVFQIINKNNIREKI
jgi:hypothetical protein